MGHVANTGTNLLSCVCEEPIMNCSATVVKRFMELKLAQQGDDKSLDYLKRLHSDVGTVFGYLGRKCKYGATVRVGAYTDPRNPAHQ